MVGISVYNKSSSKKTYFMYSMDKKGDPLYKYIMELNF